MAKQGKVITDQQKRKISTMSRKKKKISAIVKKVGVSRTTVFKYRKINRNKVKIKKIKKVGRKRVISPKQRLEIKKFLRKNPGKTARDVKKELQLKYSLRTIQRTINSLNFSWSRLKKKPELKEIDMMVQIP